MTKKIIKILLFATTIGLLLGSCEDDLEIGPEDNRLVSEGALQTEANYESFLAKLYTGLSVFGQGNGTSNDISTIRNDFSGYLRLYYQMQELPTDESVIAWSDDGPIQDLNTQTWTNGHVGVAAMYERIFFQVAQANEFLRQSAPGVLSSKGLSNESLFRQLRAEARFLRALSYWHGLDMFGDTTFVTENDGAGAPPQTTRAALFEYIESELLAIQEDLPEPNQISNYGRADKAAVWALLSKLYLNSEVYLGEGNGRFNDCIDVCNQIINAGYSIDVNQPYQNLFLADNDAFSTLNTSESEAIFTIPHDGVRTRSTGSYGTFIINASLSAEIQAEGDFGTTQAWGGIRATSVLIDLFGTPTNEPMPNSDDPNAPEDIQLEWEDQRIISFTPGHRREVESLTTFTDGYAITKFKNLTVDGQPGSDSQQFTDMDFHMFRLADIYLTYAESVLRGATNGDMNAALDFVNILRTRAYGGSTANNISSAELTLDFIIDERGRELYWENHRRTDLIRFNRFTENSIWEFKGGVQGGQTTPEFRNLYPIPQSEINVNTNNIEQNPGY